MRDATPERMEAWGRLTQKVDDIVVDVGELDHTLKRIEEQIREMRQSQLGQAEQNLAVATQAKRADDLVAEIMRERALEKQRRQWLEEQHAEEQQKWKRRGKWAWLSITIGTTVAGQSLPTNMFAFAERVAALLARFI